MRKLLVIVGFRTVAATSLLSLSLFMGVPSLAQEAEGDDLSDATEIVVDAEEEEAEEEPLEALTHDNPKIPIDQLEILLKPLTQEQVQAEADAWYGLLQEKAAAISVLELDIKLLEEKITGDIDSKKEKEVVEVTQLKTEQTSLISRVTTVLDDLDAKGGDSTVYRQYVEAISGIELSLTDTDGLGLRFTTWLQSEEGGIRLGLNLLKFGGILIAAAFIAPRAGKITDVGLMRIENISTLFRGFIVMIVKRGVLVIGGLLALASLGVNLGPIVAVLGGASFVLAFALQSNLGNFASGLMLLVTKPFDVGDEVKVAGYWAFVDSISLANTKLKDFNGSLVSLPNNNVWGGDIINYSHNETRKVSLSINVKFEQDIDKIESIWRDMCASHPDVLKDPAPSIFAWNSTFDYYLPIGLKATVPTEIHWAVYTDLLKKLQVRLAQEGVELVSPIQDRRVAQLPPVVS